MTIFVVEVCDGLDDVDHRVIGVYSTEARALDACAILGVEGIVMEFELDA